MTNTRLASALCAALLLIRSPATHGSNISYTYDPAGRLVSADYGTNTISYVYDNAGNLILTSQPAPGLVVSRPSTSQIALFWPIAPGGFVLFSSGTLGASAQWNISGAIQFQTGDLNVVTQAIGSANKFYRLQK